MRQVTAIGAAFSALYFLSVPAQPVQAQDQTVDACTINPAPTGCDGLWALQVDQQVPHGAYVFVPNPGCMNDTSGALEQVVQAAVAAGIPQAALFSGSISKFLTPIVAEELAQHGGFISEHLSPYAKNGAMCAPVVAVVPLKADVVGFRLAAHDETGWGGCNPGSDCGIGWSKFQSQPVEIESTGMRTYMTMFMNWSHNRDRTARMIIFYRLPKGQRPLVQM